MAIVDIRINKALGTYKLLRGASRVIAKTLITITLV